MNVCKLQHIVDTNFSWKIGYITKKKISKHKIIAFGVSMKCIVWALVFKKEFHLNIQEK